MIARYKKYTEQLKDFVSWSKANRDPTVDEIIEMIVDNLTKGFERLWWYEYNSGLNLKE